MRRLGYITMTVSMGFIMASCDKSETEDAIADEEVVSEAPKKKDKERDKEAERRAAERKAKREAVMAKLRQGSAPKASSSTTTRKKKDKPDAGGDVSEEKWKEIEDKLVARRGAKGTSLGTVTLAGGRTLEEVLVKDADSIGITAYHKAGIETIEYADMPAELQARFIYDPEEAEAAAAGKPLPKLPAARMRAVEKRIGEEQVRLANAEAKALQEATAAASAAARAREKELQAKLDKAVSARAAVSRSVGKAEERLYDLEDAAKVARFGKDGARVKKSGADTMATRSADKKVADQRRAIAALEEKLRKCEAAVEAARQEISENRKRR